MITVHSLGAKGEIGNLYDASCDNVMEKKLFTEREIKPSKPYLPKAPPIITRLDSLKSLSETLSAMNINQHLQISLLCEDTRTPSLVDIKALDNWVGLYIEMGKHEEFVDPSEITSLECEDEPSATHVITKVCYGYYSFIILQWKDHREIGNKEKIKATALTVLRKKLAFLEENSEIDSKEFGWPKVGKEIDKEFKVYIGVPSSKTIDLKSFDDAFNTITESIKDSYSIRYELLPLNKKMKIHNYCSLNRSIRNTALDILTEIVNHKYILSQLSRHSNDYSTRYSKAVENIETLSRTIKEARTRRTEMQGLMAILKTFSENLRDLNDDSNAYKSLLFKEYLRSHGFSTLSYEEFRNRNKKERKRKEKKKKGKKAYVLFANIDKIDLETDKNSILLKRLKNEDTKGTLVYIIDNESVPPGESTKLSNKCHSFVNGTLEESDLLATIGKDLEISLISGQKEELLKHPNVSSQAVFKCPSFNCSGNDDEFWLCSSCTTSQIRYSSENTSFFCLKCMIKIPIDAARYRCNKESHGVQYIAESHKAKAAVKNLKETEEKNILILGETGVGKSTWINGIRNYMEFDELDEAVNDGGPIALIPSQFTFTDTDGVSFLISVGDTKDSNERNDVGKSCTKIPQSYTFTRENGQVVNLIDTPGLCDTENIDDENFKNILKHIEKYECIHAICILLKPNNARLTVIFRYCINELLAHFHKGAVNNIVFCFTNSRSTFYCPGDTLPPLMKLLKEHNLNILDTKEAKKERLYCFDNEAFRFLAILKNGIEMNQSQFKDYSCSWDRSVNETNRLFDKIMSFEGHETKQTIDINQARDLIVRMAKPLAEMSKTINNSISAIKDAKLISEGIENTAKDLESKLHFKGIDLVKYDLAMPRTVCAHNSCTERKLVGETQRQTTLYPQHCHPTCYLTGVSSETTRDPLLKHCAAMNSTGYCNSCSHHHSEHMHLTYEYEKVVKDFMSPETKAEIAKKKTLQEKNEEFIRQKDIKINELNKEYHMVITTSAKFACFLNNSAIVYYNDSVEEYLKHLLKEEKNKDKHMQNETQILKLNATIEEYVKQREMLENALKNTTGDDGIDLKDPDIIIKLKKELLSLNNYGYTFSKILDSGQSYLAETTKFYRTYVPSKPIKKQKGIWEKVYSYFGKTKHSGHVETDIPTYQGRYPESTTFGWWKE